MVPLSSNETTPHGSASSISAAERVARDVETSVNRTCPEVFAHERNRLFRRAHVRTVARCLHHSQRAARGMLVNVFTNRIRGDHVLRTLKDERWDSETRQIFTIVREERRLGETPRDHRVGRTEALRQLLTK